jgi:putative oxidoreductase
MLDMRTAPYAALLLRVTLGFLFIAHLYFKFYVRDGGFEGWWTNLNNNGYPDWVVFYVVVAETIGAICLIPGILTRWVALLCVPLMIGAAQYWLARTGFFFTAAGAELPILWTIALLAQAGLGDGAYALVRSPELPFMPARQRMAAE